MEEIFLFNDTETLGFPKPGAAVQPGQSRVCQIALLLTDATGNPLCEFSSFIKPSHDWPEMHPKAFEAHGFTTEHCEKYGLNYRAVFALYARLASMATVIIAHNSEFDERMMEIEQGYYNEFSGQPPMRVSKPWECTMKPNTNIVKAPKKQGSGYKWPSLEETLKHFCGRELGSFAHDAMYDVKACRDIFFAKRNGQSSKLPERIKA